MNPKLISFLAASIFSGAALASGPLETQIVATAKCVGTVSAWTGVELYQNERFELALEKRADGTYALISQHGALSEHLVTLEDDVVKGHSRDNYGVAKTRLYLNGGAYWRLSSTAKGEWVERKAKCQITKIE